MNSDFDEVRYFWAQMLRISGPQWLLLLATADLDNGNGAPAGAIASRLQVNANFVTASSKLLEKKGFLKRTLVSVDEGLRLSLTKKTFASLAEQKAITRRFAEVKRG